MAHHVHQKQLHSRLRIHSLYRPAKALQAIHAGDDDVGHAPVLELCDYLQPELGPFGLGDPWPQEFLLASHVDAQRQIHRFGTHHARVTGFDVDAVQINDRVQRIQWTRLPGLGLVHDGIRNR